MAFGPHEKLTVKEMLAQGRKKIIETAREMALDAGSSMIPPDDRDVKVYVKEDEIKAVLNKGLRAYDDDGSRRIESVTIEVRFNDTFGSVQHEGDDILTEEDKKTIDFIMKKMPPNYEYVRITIIDNPKTDPDNYIVQISSEHTMGSHTVDRKTGEWTYQGHKHYARRPTEGWTELKE